MIAISNRLCMFLITTVVKLIQTVFHHYLVPRVFLTLAVEQYRHDKVTCNELLLRLRDLEPDYEQDGDALPVPAECALPRTHSAFSGSDPRWGPSADGRCFFDPSRGPAFESFVSQIADSLSGPVVSSSAA